MVRIIEKKNNDGPKMRKTQKKIHRRKRNQPRAQRIDWPQLSYMVCYFVLCYLFIFIFFFALNFAVDVIIVVAA